MNNVWEIAGGSIIGRDHVRSQKNNQDSFFWTEKNGLLVAAVSDGCSAGSKSEVGANLGCRLLVKNLEAELISVRAENFNRLVLEVALERARQDTLAEMRILAKSLGGSFSSVVEEYFLFTLLGGIFTEKYSALFAVGDGLFFLNGEKIELGPFPGNKPPYLSYALVDNSLGTLPELFRFRIFRFVETKDVENCLIATDGAKDLLAVTDRQIPGKEEVVGEISRFWQDDKYFTNPDQLRRRLTLLNRDSKLYDPRTATLKVENGLLPDDTTFIVIRRREGG